MKKLLIISGRGFPPENETGIFRVLKFVKYLDRLGWQSVVLAPKMNVETEKDPSLVGDIPRDTKVVRTANLSLMLQHHSMQKLAKSSLVFDSDIGWFPTAFRKASRIIESEGINAIFSTSPPVTSHIIGHRLKKRFKIPWVADFRDLWTQHQNYWSPTEHHRKFEEKLEAGVANSADKLIFITPRSLDRFKEKYPSIPPENMTLIPHGFDTDDFTGMNRARDPRMIFSYVGTIDHHYPLTFLKAFEELQRELPDIKDRVLIVLCGKVHNKKLNEIKKFKLGGMLEFKGFLPYHESIQQMMNSDVLLLTFGKDQGFRDVYPIKIVNYLAAKRFILATIPANTIVGALIETSNSGVVVNPDDVKAVKTEILRLYETFARDGRIDIRQEFDVVSKFNMENQSRQLAKIFDSLTIK